MVHTSSGGHRDSRINRVATTRERLYPGETRLRMALLTIARVPVTRARLVVPL